MGQVKRTCGRKASQIKKPQGGTTPEEHFNASINHNLLKPKVGQALKPSSLMPSSQACHQEVRTKDNLVYNKPKSKTHIQYYWCKINLNGSGKIWLFD